MVIMRTGLQEAVKRKRDCNQTAEMFYSELGINAFFARCVSLAISSPEPTHYQSRTKENTSVRQSHIFKQSHIIKASKGNGLVVEEMIAQIRIRQLECSVEVTSVSASISKFFGTFFLFLQTKYKLFCLIS